MKQMIDESFLSSIACGSLYLGSGGGGDTTLLQFMAKQAIREHGPIPLVSPFHFPEEEWAIPVGIMGSPTILSEKLPSGQELKQVLSDLEQEKKIVATALTGLEIGGMNAIAPILAGALNRLPVLDADGMGRAFPEIHMTTFHAYGVQASPFMMRNEAGMKICLCHPSNQEIEIQSRRHVAEMGGWAAIACYAMRGREVQETGILHSFSLAKRLGDAVMAAGADVHRVIASLTRTFQNSIYGTPIKMIEGQVVDLQRDIVEGIVSGRIIVEGSGYDSGEQAEVLFQNEYLLVKLRKHNAVTVPDLIAVLDADTGYPISIEELEHHMRVFVIAIPSPSVIRNPKMLDFVAPEHFGLNGDFKPVDKLVFREGGGLANAASRN